MNTASSHWSCSSLSLCTCESVRVWARKRDARVVSLSGGWMDGTLGGCGGEVGWGQHSLHRDWIHRGGACEGAGPAGRRARGDRTGCQEELGSATARSAPTSTVIFVRWHWVISQGASQAVTWLDRSAFYDFWYSNTLNKMYRPDLLSEIWFILQG